MILAVYLTGVVVNVILGITFMIKCRDVIDFRKDIFDIIFGLLLGSLFSWYGAYKISEELKDLDNWR